jgi:hypothetical protein
MWDTSKQKLLCFMLIDDSLGEKIYGPEAKGIAYWRAFIVEDRKTGEVMGMYRFKHPDGTRNWVHIKPKNPAEKRDAVVARLRCGLEDTINIAAKVAGLPNRVQCFYPPDDGGDAGKTIIWLEQHDLIEISRVLKPGEQI